MRSSTKVVEGRIALKIARPGGRLVVEAIKQEGPDRERHHTTQTVKARSQQGRVPGAVRARLTGSCKPLSTEVGEGDRILFAR